MIDLCDLICPDPLLARLEDNGICTDEIDAIRIDDFDEAVVGYADEGRLVYSFEKMVEVGMEKNGWDLEESTDYVSSMLCWYHTGSNSPIIMYEVE